MKRSLLESVIENLYSFIDYEKLGGKNPYNTKEEDIERFRRLLCERGNRHKEYKTILVAGSKGKGSTAAMLESMLHIGGYKTGLYTSPHLVDIRERFRIDGRCVEDDVLARKIEDITRMVTEKTGKRGFRTVFEIMTASAFEIFADADVDYAIIEVGIGGRLDATNAIDPDVSIITTIGLDHTHILGDTVELIAGEKACIIRNGKPLIIGYQSQGAHEVILSKARDLGAEPIVDLNVSKPLDNISISRQGTVFNYRDSNCNLSLVELSLIGEHQAENAAIAIAASRLLELDESSIRAGLCCVNWPGRLQLVGTSPDIIVDGAHGPMAFKRLVEAIRQTWGCLPVWIFAANKDKDIAGMLDVVKSCKHNLILTTFDWPRAASPEELLAIAGEGFTTDDFKQALDKARELAGASGLIVIAGSLYLAGVALKENGSIPCELFTEYSTKIDIHAAS
ncbi:bifunctional folylpolyglutamate synthase/dihydrofolate synthase [bacterium]|nr:bifunctional folylpolyglutamate synthase/dihydrofolate synthase [bacterium]